MGETSNEDVGEEQLEEDVEEQVDVEKCISSSSKQYTLMLLYK